MKIVPRVWPQLTLLIVDGVIITVRRKKNAHPPVAGWKTVVRPLSTRWVPLPFFFLQCHFNIHANWFIAILQSLLDFHQLIPVVRFDTLFIRNHNAFSAHTQLLEIHNAPSPAILWSFFIIFNSLDRWPVQCKGQLRSQSMVRTLVTPQSLEGSEVLRKWWLLLSNVWLNREIPLCEKFLPSHFDWNNYMHLSELFVELDLPLVGQLTGRSRWP